MAEHQELIAKIQAGGWLVHNQDLGLLRECARDQHELALLAAEL
jgi:hypothetical protein